MQVGRVGGSGLIGSSVLQEDEEQAYRQLGQEEGEEKLLLVAPSNNEA